MKKKLGYILFSLVFIFLLVGDVFAQDINFELKLSSDKVINGTYAEVKLVTSTVDNNLVDYCNFIIESSDELEFSEIQSLNSWIIYTNNSTGHVVDIMVKNNQSFLNGTINILNIKYAVNADGFVKLSNAMCYDAGGNMLSTYGNNSELEIKTINNMSTMLKSLKINNEELNPNFSPDVTSYNINNFKANSLNLEYEVNDSMFQEQVVVTVNDKIVNDLNNIPYEVVEGNNAMLVTINVADIQAYNIFVAKQDDSSYNNTISSIIVNGESLEVVPGKYDYVHVVSDDVTSVEVLAMLSDEENFQFGNSSNAPATFDMTGKITAIMTVVSKNNQNDIPTATYTVTVVNEKNASNLSKPDVNDNPDTSDTTMYVMAIILLMSLFGSIFLYQKNLSSYK